MRVPALLALACLLALPGCASALADATRTANATKAAALAADAVLTDECVKPVAALPTGTEAERAESRAVLARLRAPCQDLSDAYRVARLAHAALVAAIAAGETEDPAALTVRVLQTAEAARKLAASIDKVRQ